MKKEFIEKRDSLNSDSAILQLDSKENKLLDESEAILNNIKRKYNIKEKQVIDILYQKGKYISIPVYVFATKLSPLESIVKYLKEELDLSFNEIAALLNRDSTTIWTTYNNAKQKIKERFAAKKSKYALILASFSDRRLSILESVSEHLHEDCNLKFHDIAVLLNKNDRTIWTTYHRAKKKREKFENK
ncbi:MAG: hypothetical protein KAU20_01405 [Nanoarchaeota archaeon]|nr:hypothetical protein [Nanoarchaeota archaeon]